MVLLIAVLSSVLAVQAQVQPRPLPPVPPVLSTEGQLPRVMAPDPRIEQRLRQVGQLLPIEGIWAVRLETFDTTGGEVRPVREDYTFELAIAQAEAGAEMPIPAIVISSTTERAPMGSIYAELTPTADPQLYLVRWLLPGFPPRTTELKLEGSAVATAEIRDIPRFPLVTLVRMVKLRPRAPVPSR
jgi:hypothetical protein